MRCFARFGTICTIKKNVKNTLAWVFSRFLNCTNSTKSRNASQINTPQFLFGFLQCINQKANFQFIYAF